MLILEHLKLIEQLTGVDRKRIYPAKFGFEVPWNAAAQYELAANRVPENSALLVLRVECYTVSQDVSAPDFGMVSPPPSGTAYWKSGPILASGDAVTNMSARTHVVLDSDELLLFNPNQVATLTANFLAAPDAFTRKVRTLVYGYYVPYKVADALGLSQATHLENA